MPGIFSSLMTAAGALTAFDRGLATSQNNVANAGTPGFARQRVSLQAMPFDPEAGMQGGVRPGELESARDEYAEIAVRRELGGWGRGAQSASVLSRIEPLFDATGQSGVPAALTSLFQSFSALSISPNDAAARRVVLDRAEELSARFRETATALREARAHTEGELGNAVEAVNRIAGALCAWNAQVCGNRSAAVDPNLDATLHTRLEELAEYVDFTYLRNEDGAVSVLLDGGQTPLVIGTRQYVIGADLTATGARILDFQGRDVTAQIGSGRVAALIALRNDIAPAYIADLDRLAARVADRVNEVLAAGIDSAGNAGAPLFSYDAVTGAALTIAAEPLSISEIAAADPAAPGGNGNALALAALAGSAELDGQSFMAFYGGLSARAGRDLAAAREAADSGEQRTIQARTLRDEASAVSLDEEAMRILQFQRAYEAAAKLITVLDELTETTINMLRR